MRATVLSPGVSRYILLLAKSNCHPSKSGLIPLNPSPSPLSLLPVLTLCLPDSSRPNAGFTLALV